MTKQSQLIAWVLQSNDDDRWAVFASVGGEQHRLTNWHPERLLALAELFQTPWQVKLPLEAQPK